MASTTAPALAASQPRPFGKGQFSDGKASALEEAAVELTVIAAVTALVPVMLTEDGETLQVGRYCAPLGKEASAQER
jgi:hypothetical protein